MSTNSNSTFTRRSFIAGGAVLLAGMAGSGAYIYTTKASAQEAAGFPGNMGDMGDMNGNMGGFGGTTTSTVSTAMVAKEDLIDTTDLFSDRDLEQTADTTSATTIDLTDGQDVSITEEGVYEVSGTASDVTITVNAPEAKVQLVLDGASITNTDFPAIYVVDADKVFVTTTDSDNTLAVTDAFVADGETNTDAVIFSKDDLTLNGTGTLTIESAQGNGITSKDDLVITGGVYNITAGEHALQAHDSISICDGTFTIDAGKDGIHSKDSDDDTVGFIYISGGDFSINATNQGIQGTTVVMIDGGILDITATEGIEGTYIQINGGTITINATDDGINATAMSQSYGVVVEINDGEVTITMASGDTDAIDANGSIYINGGTVTVTTSGMSSFDYDQTGEINGGTVTVNGEQITEMPSDMMGGFGGGMGGQMGGQQIGGGAGGFGGGPMGGR